MSKYPPLKPLSATPFKVCNFGRTGSGKTASLATLLLAGQKLRFLSADNNANAGLEAGMKLHGISKEDVDLGICIPDRPTLSSTEILGVIDNFLKTDLDVMMKGKDKFRKENTGFRNIYSGAINFIDTISGKDMGNVLEWGQDTTLAIDSLTVVCNEIQLTVSGNKPITQPEWGAQQSLLKNFIAYITSTVKCNVVLLAHPTKETDPINGTTTIYPLNLGQALNESFSSNFSDVVYSQFDSKKYFWSTKHRTAVCSGRILPIKEELDQDYRQFFKR